MTVLAGLLTALLTIVVVALGVLYVYFKRSFGYWSIRGVPHTKPKFPFGDIGEANLTKNIGVVMKELYDKFPKERFFGMWFLNRPGLVVRDPELIKYVIVRDFMYFQDRGVYYNEKDDPLSGEFCIKRVPVLGNIVCK